MLTTLTDQVLGEIPNMRYIEEFDLLDEPRKESHILLAELPEKLREYGMDLSVDPHACLESYMGYQMEADEDPDADWRWTSLPDPHAVMPLSAGIWKVKMTIWMICMPMGLWQVFFVILWTLSVKKKAARRYSIFVTGWKNTSAVIADLIL